MPRGAEASATRAGMAYNNRSALDILCRINGSVFPRVLLKALGFGLIGVVALVLYEHDPERYSSVWTPESDMHTYMGMMVALLIGFRTNNCYTRYDQGVRISGAMRTHARTIVGQAAAYIALGNDGEGQRHIDEIRRLTMLLCLFFKRHMHGEDSGFSTAFSRAVKHVTNLQRASRVHGRGASAGTEPLLLGSATGSPGVDESADSGGAEHQIGEWNGGLSVEEMQLLQSCKNGTERVVLCSVWLRQRINTAMDDALLKEAFATVMDERITDSIENFQAACRLVFVPMPFPYAQVVKFVIMLFCGVTPFSIVDQVHWWTPFATFLLAILFLAVEEIGVEIEDPFGRKESDASRPNHGSLQKHPYKQTHFVNLEAVIREIDATTAMIVASRSNTSRQLLLSGDTDEHFSVCER